jgi:hypothetical protein
MRTFSVNNGKILKQVCPLTFVMKSSPLGAKDER